MTGNPEPHDELTDLIPDLSRLAYYLTGNRDAAQDLCQEVLLKLWTRLREGERIGNLRGYAVIALKNQHRQTLRRRPGGGEVKEDALAHAPEAFASLALRELDLAIARLPADQARLMRLVARGETSPRDLARLTGWPRGTVMSRLARARARLRADMGLGSGATVQTLL